MAQFLAGLDLGQVSDPAAIAVVEAPTGVELVDLVRKKIPVVLKLRHLERLELGTSYPAIARHVTALLKKPPLYGNVELVVDATGVGRAVMDLLREHGLDPIGVTATGGDKTTQDGRDYKAPKRDLVVALQVLLQDKRLVIAKSLKLGEVFRKELQDFRMKINAKTAHDSYEARQGAHDDLVFAVALACWRATLGVVALSGPGISQEAREEKDKLREWYASHGLLHPADVEQGEAQAVAKAKVQAELQAQKLADQQAQMRAVGALMEAKEKKP